jgi:hypothetical protein
MKNILCGFLLMESLITAGFFRTTEKHLVEFVRVLLSVQWSRCHSAAKFENPLREEIEGGGENREVDRHQLLGPAHERGKNSPHSLQTHEGLPGYFGSKRLAGNEHPGCRSGGMEPPLGRL